ncbi:M48 family metalloprotease [Chitinilyticum piscinae]|uniref:M48 family metalloprotease n=1 Tax=Chitinilyticum piscinae TaxID=2866724 RepID=A0A8J7FHS6_9NEIS|nr:M48 family metalloprotease [Chitinilyticum piscinae]MBE9608445.1 M48 family metalloprotease [Chitinilyticum piscinae]
MLLSVVLVAGSASALDLNKLVGSKDTVDSAVKAATFSDADARAMADAACQESDLGNRIASDKSKYGKRLAVISKKMGNEINGIPVNYKVYETNEVNAWAMANGCIRVYSGLMDMMTDDEVIGVLGHEMGHVALGHTKKAYQMAYATAAARSAAGTFGNKNIQELSKSDLGLLTENLINAQFSQSQELDADNFSFDLLTKKNLNREALASAFRKLEKLSGNDHSLMSSHPASADRAKNVETRIASGK